MFTSDVPCLTIIVSTSPIKPFSCIYDEDNYKNTNHLKTKRINLLEIWEWIKCRWMTNIRNLAGEVTINIHISGENAPYYLKLRINLHRKHISQYSKVTYTSYLLTAVDIMQKNGTYKQQRVWRFCSSPAIHNTAQGSHTRPTLKFRYKYSFMHIIWLFFIDNF